MKRNEREKAKPLANGSCSAPIVANQNQIPVTSFAQNQFLYFPKTRSSFPISPFFFGLKKKEKDTESFRWASLTLYMWRFDRTLTPLRVRHAPDSSSLKFCTHLHGTFNHLPLPYQITILPSYVAFSNIERGAIYDSKQAHFLIKNGLHRFRSKRWVCNFFNKFPVFFYSFFLGLKRSNGNAVRSP